MIKGRYQYPVTVEPLKPIVAPSTTVFVAVATSAVIFSQSFIYQAKAEPIPVTKEVVTVDKWFEPLSEPVRLKHPINKHYFLSFAPTHAPTVPGGAVLSQSPVSIQVEYRFQYQGIARPVLFKQETVTVDKWFESWTDPVRTKPGLRTELQQTTTIDTRLIPNPAKLPEGWIQPFSDPPRINANRYFAALTASGLSWSTFTPSVVTAVNPSTYLSGVTFPQSLIYQTKTDPVRVTAPTPPPNYFPMVAGDSGVSFQKTIIYQTSAEVAFSVNAIAWYEPLAEPIRTRSLSVALQPAFFAPSKVVTETITIDKWYAPFRDPVRIRTLPVAEQQTIAFYSKPVVSFGYYGWLSEPVREKPGLRASLQQSFATDPTFIPNPSKLLEGWQYPWSEPVRTRNLSVAQQQSVAFYSRPIVSFGYYNWLSEPVREKPGLRTALQQSFTIGLPSFETVTVDKWFVPLQDPVRTKLGLLAAEQQFFATDPTFIPNPSKLLEGYLYPLSEPVRTKYLPTSEYPYLAYIFIAENITADKWIYPWSEPVRTRSLPVAHQQSVAFYSKPVVSFGYYNWLAEPVRSKAGLRADLQQSFATDPTFIPNPSKLLEGYLYPLSEPVRTRYLSTAQQQSLAWTFVPTTEVITEDKWHQPWTTPVRTKPRLLESQQQFFATDPTFIPNPKKLLEGWHYPWSEPVRLKVGLSASLQQAATPAFPIYPILNRLVQWFAPLSDPVRLKPGLSVNLQQSFTSGRPTDFPITMTLSVKEINADIALFGIDVVSAVPTPYVLIAGANVTISEIPATKSGAVSIKEDS